jgi:hypothetical protein
MLAVDAEAALFSLKSFVAAIIAYYIALRIGFAQPVWAMTTVYVVSQPLAGTVLSKAVFRLLGTILGATAAVVLVPAFVNEPLVLSFALALWLGLCAYIAQLDRTPRSYTFLLAGYTAAIIGFPSVGAPGDIAIPPIIAQRQAALYALTALMGRPTADYPQELEDCPAPPSLRQPLPVGDGVALIRRRSDVRSAERSLAAATASIGVETAALYPQVSLGGQVGYAGPFSTIGSASSFGGNVGPLLSWTFPNRSLAHARIAEAGAAARAAQAQFDGTVLNALQQTEAALNTYVHELDHNQALGQARDSAAKSTSQARALLRFGRTSVLDVLNVEASLATAETAVASSDAAIADDQVNIFLALGGGWDQPDRSQ